MLVMMRGWFKQTFLRVTIAIVLLLPFVSTPSVTHAGAINARTERSSIKLDESNKTVSLKFDVEVVYNGVIDSTKGIENGTATATYTNDIQNFTWNLNVVTNISYRAKTARLYKIDVSSFKPYSVSDGTDSTPNENSLWSSTYLLVIDRTVANVEQLPNAAGWKPLDGGLATIGLFVRNTSSGWLMVGGRNELESSVQEALIYTNNYVGGGYSDFNYVTGSGSSNSDLSVGEARQLLAQYNFQNISVEDEADQKTTPKPPIILLQEANTGSRKNGLVFELTEVALVGGQIGSDNHYFWFKARGRTNLWIIIGEGGNVLYSVSSTAGSQTGDSVYGRLGIFKDAPSGNVDIKLDKSSFDDKIMHRVFNICDSASNCTALNFTKIVDYPDTQTEFGTSKSPWNHQIAVNSNNKNKDAWLNKWGVTYADLQSEGDFASACGITVIFSGDISTIFGKVVECLFTGIFLPLINYAADTVQKAAGVSYLDSQPDRPRYWQLAYSPENSIRT